MQLLFYSRLLLYFLAALLPVAHPAVVVPYDVPGWVLWLGIVPLEAFVAFYLLGRFRLRLWLSAAVVPLLLFTLLFTGVSSEALRAVGAAALGFGLTTLIFKSGPRGYPVALVEPFVLGYLFYKLLSFSRASESLARESSGIAQLLLVVIVCAFLLHAMILFFAAFRDAGVHRRLKEAGVFVGVAVPLLALVVFVLPPDFVSHSAISNVFREPPQPEPMPLDEQMDGLNDGNFRGDSLFGPNQGNGQDQGGQQGEAQLFGVPSDQWGRSQGRRQNGEGTGGRSQQRAVMVIAGDQNPIYAADGYFADLHPQQGFQISRGQMLNELPYMRLAGTWENDDPSTGQNRARKELMFMSTISERTVPFEPYSIQPTVLDRRYHPFDFSYQAVSRISQTTDREFAQISGLSDAQRQEMSEYLEVPLEPEVKEDFREYLEQATRGTNGYFEKAIAIFEDYSDFQYQIGFTDNVSISHMREFLLNTRSGDCTEFSNATAILARMAGIPTRVVTGYLGAEGLQTPAHRQGLASLQQSIPPLQEYALSELKLVTTAHRHSWLQMYMPGYGWVDFDPTSYAIPPQGGGNPNNMDVVIPMIQSETIQTAKPFPWWFIGRLGAGIVAALVIGVYGYRGVRMLYLSRVARHSDQRGLRALWTLLLMRLSLFDYDLKPRSSTALEYAERYPELQRFASIYTTLRYRERMTEEEWDELWRQLREEYRHLVQEHRSSGPWALVKRLFSLKVLYY